MSTDLKKQAKQPAKSGANSFYTPDQNRTIDFAENVEERFRKIPEYYQMVKQESKILPSLLERFIVCKNYYRDNYYGSHESDTEAYLKLLIADILCVVLDQQKRIQFLEGKISNAGI